MSRIFCCNFLAELEELLKEEKVDVDYVKFPSIDADFEWLKRALELKPVIFHGFPPNDGSLCKSDFTDNFDVNTYKHYVNLTKTPHISGHITAYCHHYPDYSSEKKDLYKEKILNNTIDNINFLKNILDLPVVLENVTYAPYEEKIKCVTDTDFINKVVRDTDSYFLFDVSHARVTAYYRNIDFKQYINKLPMDRIYEVHLNGIVNYADGTCEAPHTKVNEEDYELLEYLLKNTHVKVVTLEYGPKDSSYNFINPNYKEELYEQINRIKKILNKY